MNISEILKNYDLSNVHIWVLWWHSALDVCAWAKKYWLKTVCIAKKWREKTYSKHYKSRKITKEREIWCIDECIVIDEWEDLLKKETQEKLRKLNTIFIHNRYFWTYFNFEEIENNFKVPIYGSRELIKLEERDVPKNQYYLLEKAGIRIPKMFDVPKLNFKNWKLSFFKEKTIIDWFSSNNKEVHLTLKEEFKPEEFKRLTLTKVNNAIRTYERENFVAKDWNEWKTIAEEKLNEWKIKIETLQLAVIEEFVLWAQINFNFFHSKITWEIELLWTDMRRQTNLDWLLRLPAQEQLKLWNKFTPAHIETWHVAVTCKESLLEKAFIAGESFVKTCKKETQELIWPFALQGAIETDWKKEEFLVFDVSMRIPWSPWISATPYTNYLYWQNISMWERIAIEIHEALDNWRIEEILT